MPWVHDTAFCKSFGKLPAFCAIDIVYVVFLLRACDARAHTERVSGLNALNCVATRG